MYQQTANAKLVKHVPTGTFIPVEGDGYLQREYHEWLAAGGVLQPLPGPTVEEQERALSRAVDRRLDEFAQAHGYRDISVAASYSGDKRAKYAAEGTYCRDIRSDTWHAFETTLAQVREGVRQMPTEEELMALLPALVWPT